VELQRIVSIGGEAGWETRIDRDSHDPREKLNYRFGSDSFIKCTDAAISDIDSRETAKLKFYFNGLRFALFINPRGGVFNHPHVEVRSPRVEFKWKNRDNENEARAKAQNKVDTYISVISLLAAETRPSIAVGRYRLKNADRSGLPTDEEIERGMSSKLYWINVWKGSPDTEVGGTALRDSPAYLVEAVDDTRVLVVSSENPVHHEGWPSDHSKVASALGLET
jgi:hypothetical protein